MDQDSLQRALTGVGTPALRYFATLGSSMDAGRAWLETGAPDMALIVAEEQTAGRGRLNRRWFTPSGSALAFSLLLHPTAAEMPHLLYLPALAGLAVCQALEKMGLMPQLKWPNDVLVERQKLCGILVEAAWQGSSLLGVVIGLGINVTSASVPPPEQVQFPAACVEQFTGQTISRETLLAEILHAFVDWRPLLGSAQFMQAWEQRLAFRSEWVRLERCDGAPPLTGQLIGLSAQGHLRLLTAAGAQVEIEVGDVHLRPQSG